MNIDLHLHSNFSPDAISSPTAICRAAVQKGLDAIALTDHDTTVGWEVMREAAAEAGLLFIPGEERKVIADDQIVGEVLCLFLREPVQSCDLVGIIGEVHSQGGLVIAAHPFDQRRPAIGRYCALAEYQSHIAFEIFNGRSYGGRGNHLSGTYATIYELPVTAGSDAHTPFEVGNVSVEAEARTAEELKQAILHHQILVRGRISHPIFSLYSGLRKLGFCQLL